MGLGVGSRFSCRYRVVSPEQYSFVVIIEPPVDGHSLFTAKLFEETGDRLKVCSHVTKFSPSLIFDSLLFSIVSMNNRQNGRQTHSARYSARHH